MVSQCRLLRVLERCRQADRCGREERSGAARHRQGQGTSRAETAPMARKIAKLAKPEALLLGCGRPPPGRRAPSELPRSRLGSYLGRSVLGGGRVFNPPCGLGLMSGGRSGWRGQ
jgi:hypothetical protein